MKVMRTTVATVVAATLSMSAFSVFAEASLTGAGATFPAPVYAIINVINHQPGVVLRRRHVIQTLIHVGQLSDQCRIVRKPFMRLFEHFPRLCDITAIPQGVTKRCLDVAIIRFQFQRGAQITHRRRDIMTLAINCRPRNVSVGRRRNID